MKREEMPGYLERLPYPFFVMVCWDKTLMTTAFVNHPEPALQAIEYGLSPNNLLYPKELNVTFVFPTTYANGSLGLEVRMIRPFSQKI